MPLRQRTTSNLPVTERENSATVPIDTLSLSKVLRFINREDRKVPAAVAEAIPQIAASVELIVPRLAQGGRLVYLGAGTSGRLGVLDAAECVPTFGTNQVVGVLAGGPRAMFRALEGVEDQRQAAVRDLGGIKLSSRDAVVAISASGRTPYSRAGLAYARSVGAATVAITSNPATPMGLLADVAIVLVVGPEVIAGSTRMKAGSAQKLALNMISTACMVRLGRVYSNWMVNMQLNNAKLRSRARRILQDATGTSPAKASRAVIASNGKLPVALLMLWKNSSRDEAERELAGAQNIAAVLRAAEREWRKNRE
jgi:N-acetylmuramic acid 6-phosphate etherase